MKTEGEITAYIANLDVKGDELENEAARHQELHKLHPDAGHEQSCIVAERRLLAVRAKSVALGWVMQPSSIPED